MTIRITRSLTLCAGLALAAGVGACGDTETVIDEVYTDLALASSPTPEAGADAVATDATLGWTAPEGAVGFDVYLSTDPTDVGTGDATSDAFAGTTEAATWDTAGLDEAATYFWRIDVRYDQGVAFGRVWSFTTAGQGGGNLDPDPPSAVATPDPSNGATDVATDAALGWGAATDASSYDVYFGTEAGAVANAGNADDAFAGNVDDTTWTPEALDEGTTYFWRVDAVGDGGTTTGPLWSFTTVMPGMLARTSNPSPMMGATDVAVDTALRWDGDDDATGFMVYGDTSLNAVTVDAPTGTLIETEVTETTFAPEAPFDEGTTVYWRVDTVGDEGTVIGSVWSFDTLTPTLPLAPVPTMPMDGETDVPTTTSFAWDGEADSFTVYLAEGRDALAEVGTTTENTWMPEAPLAASSTYRWRVDATNELGTVAGTVATFDTAAPPARPWFGGAEAAVALSTDALLVTWSHALDGETAPDAMTYDVWVSPTRDIDYTAAPTAEVTGVERTVLTGDAVGSPAAGDTFWVAIRATDEDGIEDINEVVIPAYFPSTDDRIFVDADAADGGDGSAATPFNNPVEALTAVSSGDFTEVAVLMTGGDWSSATVTLETDAVVRLIGGFGDLSGDDTALLDSWDPTANVTSWSYSGELALDSVMLDLGDGVRHAIGMSFDDFGARGVRTGDGSVLLMATRIADGEYQEGILEEGETTDLYPVGLWVGGSPDATNELTITGSLCERVELCVGLVGGISRVEVLSSNAEWNQGEWVGLPYGSFDDDFFTRAAVRVNGDLAVRLAGNRGYNFEGLASLVVEPAAEDADTNTFELSVVGNRLRNIDGQTLDVEGLGQFGDDTVVDADVRENDLWAAQSDLLALTFTRYDLDEEPVPFVGALTLLGTDNVMLHGNSEVFELNALTPSTNGTVDITIARNIASHTEGEILDLDGYDFQDAEDPTAEARYRDNVTWSVVFEDNIGNGVDGGLSLTDTPLALSGDYDIVVRDNYIQGTGEAFYWSDVSLAYDPSAGLTPSSNLNVSFVDNVVEGEEDGVDLRGLQHFGGEMVFDLSRNEITTGEHGFSVRVHDAPFDALYDGDEIDIDDDYLFFAETTRLDLTIADNEVLARYDIVELYLWGGAEGSSISIANNTGVSTDDYGIGLQFGDFDTIEIHGNEMQAIDDDGFNIQEEPSFAPGATRLSLYNNKVIGCESENLRLSGFSLGDRYDDEDAAERGETEFERELDVWIANNHFVESNESDVFTLRTLTHALGLIERNVSGRVDVDSDESLELRCDAPSFFTIRNSVFWEAGGDGIDISQCGHEITNVTVGNAGGTSTSAYGVRSSGEQHFVLNSVVSGNAGDGDFHPLASPPAYSFYQYGGAPGPGSLVEDEAYRGCADPLDMVTCSRMASWSPTIDAGHPAERFNDADGSPNDMGAAGGPFAGAMGAFDDAPAAPLALIGLRPLAELSSGADLLDPESDIVLVFNQPVDADAADGAIAVSTFAGDAIAGTTTVDGHRVTFDPTARLPEATHLEIVVDTSIAGDNGAALYATEVRHVTTSTSALTIADESNDTVATASDVPAAPFRVEGGLDPYGDTPDFADLYAVELTAGDRLVATIRFDSEASGSSLSAAVSSDDGTLYSRLLSSNLPNASESEIATYFDFVAPADGTYVLWIVSDEVTYDEDAVFPDFGAPEGDVDGDAYLVTYTLDGMVRPIDPR